MKSEAGEQQKEETERNAKIKDGRSQEGECKNFKASLKSLCSSSTPTVFSVFFQCVVPFFNGSFCGFVVTPPLHCEAALQETAPVRADLEGRLRMALRTGDAEMCLGG